MVEAAGVAPAKLYFHKSLVTYRMLIDTIDNDSPFANSKAASLRSDSPTRNSANLNIV